MTHLEFTCSDEKATALLMAARMYDEQAERARHTSYSQVSNALCGKENATFDELLEAANQLKSRLAQVEREMDAMVFDLNNSLIKFAACHICDRINCIGCNGLNNWQWRGVCPENTKEEAK